MDGWTGQILRVNLTNRTHRVETFSEDFATTWIGGRGFAVKILYDELAPGIDPLGPENKLVVAVGPISGHPGSQHGQDDRGREVARHRRLRRREPGHARHGPDPQGRLRRPDRRGPGRQPDHALHRGRPGRVPAGRRGLGPGHDRDQRLDLREVRQGRRRPQHRPGRREHGPLRHGPQPRGTLRRAARHGRGHGLQAAQGDRGQGLQAHPAGVPGGDEGARPRRPQGSPGDGQGVGLVHPGHGRRAALVQRGGGAAGPQLPGHPSPRRLEGRRRAGQRGADGHLRLSELHDALRHRDPGRGGPRVGDRLREHRPPRARTSTSTTSPPSAPSTTCATTTAWTRSRPAASSGSTRTRSSRAPSRATCASATPRA